MDRLLVLIGPSGVGKSTLQRELAVRRPDVGWGRTLTTRPRRPGERCDTHRFVTPTELAAATVWGSFHHYGHDYALEPVPPGPAGTCLRAAVVGRLRTIHPALHVVALTAPVPVLLERLAQRGDPARAEPGVLSAELVAGAAVCDVELDATGEVGRLAEQVLTTWSVPPAGTVAGSGTGEGAA